MAVYALKHETTKELLTVDGLVLVDKLSTVLDYLYYHTPYSPAEVEPSANQLQLRDYLARQVDEAGTTETSGA